MKWAHKKSGMAFSGDFFSVDPARAGMILVLGPYRYGSRSGPRASGDDPYALVVERWGYEWTPRERG